MEEHKTYTAGELAKLVDGLVIGEASQPVARIADLEHADADSVSWLASADFMNRAVSSRAGVLIIPPDVTPLAGRVNIRVMDPELAACILLQAFAPQGDMIPRGVHPTAIVCESAMVDGASIGPHAYVGRDAIIGAGTVLYPGVYVGRQTKIGADCVLWPNVVVRERVTIGRHVIIHPNVTIGSDGFGYLPRQGRQMKIPQIGTVVIDDDVEIGAGSAVDRGRSGATFIGKGCKIDNLVQIAHNVTIGEHSIIVAHTAIGGSTSLGRGVILAGHVGVGDHCHLGDGCRVAAGSIVLKNTSAGQTLRGSPAVLNKKFLQQQVAVRKLPKLLERIRELEERLAKLEQG